MQAQETSINPTFEVWLRLVKNIRDTDLAPEVRDRLYAEYTTSVLKRRSKKSRKANAQVRDTKKCSDKLARQNRNSWVINYLGYDYNYAVNKQRLYFDDDYNRYTNRATFSVENLSEDEWYNLYAPRDYKCSLNMEKRIHEEYDWFYISLWEYQPMPFNTFAFIFKNYSVAELRSLDEGSLDALYEEYFNYLHDVASSNEDRWIDKLEPKLHNHEPVVTWEDLGIETDELGHPIRRVSGYREKY